MTLEGNVIHILGISSWFHSSLSSVLSPSHFYVCFHKNELYSLSILLQETPEICLFFTITQPLNLACSQNVTKLALSFSPVKQLCFECLQQLLASPAFPIRSIEKLRRILFKQFLSSLAGFTVFYVSKPARILSEQQPVCNRIWYCAFKQGYYASVVLFCCGCCLKNQSSSKVVVPCIVTWTQAVGRLHNHSVCNHGRWGTKIRD